MAIKKSVHLNSGFLETFQATSIAFERDAQRVSRQFLRSLSEPAEKRTLRK
jgi:hypothetical protein